MVAFLIDENLSPRLVFWFKKFGYAAKSVKEAGLKGKSDEDIIDWAKQHNAVIITSDFDFGEFFYFKNFGNFGVVILRSQSQNIMAFQKLLGKLHSAGILKDEKLIDSLIVIDEKSYRWRKFKFE